MKSTYEPTAKAEALSRLIRALRQEADAHGAATETRADRYRSILREIAYLEIIQAEWQTQGEEFRIWQAHKEKTGLTREISEAYDQAWHREDKANAEAIVRLAREINEKKQASPEAIEEAEAVAKTLQEEQAHQETAHGGLESREANARSEESDPTRKGGAQA